jgi:probable phosphoglycerate mutase
MPTGYSDSPLSPAEAAVTRLYLVRHGRTDWNDEGRWQGQADPPLNALGRQQALDTAQALRDVHLDAIYSSDLARARQTAQALAELLGMPVQLDARLREINQGEWEGLLVTEIQARYPHVFAQWNSTPQAVRLPGGETLHELEARFTTALDDMAAAKLGGSLAVFTHKLPIAIVRCRLHRLPLARFWDMIPANAAWELVEWPLTGGIA